MDITLGRPRSGDRPGEARETNAEQLRRSEQLKHERAVRDWSKAQLIHALRLAAAEEDVTLPSDASISRRIAMWENQGVAPDDLYARLLCRAYDKTPAGLCLPQAQAPGESVPGAEYPETPEEALTTVARLWRADLDQAGALLAVAPSAGSSDAASVEWLTSDEPVPMPEHTSGIRVGLRDVQRVKATTDMFAAMDDSYGGGHARPMLMQYLNSEVAGLLTGRYTDAVGRALFSVVAEATLLAAWMSYDTAHHGIAQRYFVQALRLAQDGGDRRLAGSILSAMSHQATFLGNFREATRLARAAQLGIARVATPTLRAQFHAMEARGLSGAGDIRGAEAALARSASALEAQRLEDEPEWITYFDAAELAAEAGHCFRDLAKAKQAVTHAVSASSGHVRSDFFVSMVLADAHLTAGDLEAACNVALDALDAGEQLKSARALTYVRDFRQHLAPYAETAAARDLSEQAANYRLWNRSS